MENLKTELIIESGTENKEAESGGKSESKPKKKRGDVHEMKEWHKLEKAKKKKKPYLQLASLLFIADWG